jgi:hypothetical protein
MLGIVGLVGAETAVCAIAGSAAANIIVNIVFFIFVTP